MAKAKIKRVTRVYVCETCHEVTAMGHGTRLDGKTGDKAPAYCASCGSPSLESKELHCALADGFHLVPCPGEAHSAEAGGHIDNCGICAPRWGLVVVPVKYANVREMREAERAAAEAEAAPNVEAAMAKLTKDALLEAAAEGAALGTCDED